MVIRGRYKLTKLSKILICITAFAMLFECLYRVINKEYTLSFVLFMVYTGEMIYVWFNNDLDVSRVVSIAGLLMMDIGALIPLKPSLMLAATITIGVSLIICVLIEKGLGYE